MGKRQPTYNDLVPNRGRDLDADRSRKVKVYLRTFSKTEFRDVFRAPSNCKIVDVVLLSETTAGVDNGNFWSFNVRNMTRQSFLCSANRTTTSQGAPVTADVGYSLAPDQNLFLAQYDVLQLQATKTASAANLQNLLVAVFYEVTGVTTTTSSSTTTTTTTSTSSTTTTTTTTSTSSSSSTSTSSTTTVSTSTTITTTSSSTTSTTTTTTSSSTSSTSTTTVT